MTEIHERSELGDADRARVEALVANVREHEQRPGLGEAKLIALRARSAAIHFLAEDNAELVGYAVLHHSSDEWAFEYCCSPATPDRVMLAVELIQHGLVSARRSSLGGFQLFMLRPSADDEAVAAELGLRATREIHEMRRPLPLEREIATARPPLLTRGFVVGRDEDALLSVNAAAFAAHPEQGAWGREELTAREARDWFDPEGIRLVEEEGQLAGFCWTKVHKEPEHLGEIYVIGIAPDFQGRGLGRGLVVDGLEYLAGRGETTASLYVEADNTAALGLYTSIGFSVAHSDRIFSVRTDS